MLLNFSKMENCNGIRSKHIRNICMVSSREDIQEMILDKMQLLIDQKLIRGIGENGMEYTVIAQC